MAGALTLLFVLVGLNGGLWAFAAHCNFKASAQAGRTGDVGERLWAAETDGVRLYVRGQFFVLLGLFAILLFIKNV